MPIGRANGTITMSDISLEYGLPYNATTGLYDIVLDSGSSTSAKFPSPVTESLNNKMSGTGSNQGFWGSTYKVITMDGTNDYVMSNAALPSTMQVSYSTPFSYTMWVYNGGGTNPISAGYQPTIVSTGGTTFGQRTFQFFYEGKLSDGTYNNRMIARITRAGFAFGRREYRWDLNTAGIITNGNGWNSVNNPGWHHLALVYDGGGASAGTFLLYWNGVLLSTSGSNNLTDGTTTWSYAGTERFSVGVSTFNTGGVNAWRMTGVCFYNTKLTSAQVTTLYNSGSGVGCNALGQDCHWWGLSGNVNDRGSAYGVPTSFSNYNLVEYNSPAYSTDTRPGY